MSIIQFYQIAAMDYNGRFFANLDDQFVKDICHGVLWGEMRA
jgi:hypothetical protein